MCSSPDHAGMQAKLEDLQAGQAKAKATAVLSCLLVALCFENPARFVMSTGPRRDDGPD